MRPRRLAASARAARGRPLREYCAGPGKRFPASACFARYGAAGPLRGGTLREPPAPSGDRLARSGHPRTATSLIAPPHAFRDDADAVHAGAFGSVEDVDDRTVAQRGCAGNAEGLVAALR